MHCGDEADYYDFRGKSFVGTKPPEVRAQTLTLPACHSATFIAKNDGDYGAVSGCLM